MGGLVMVTRRLFWTCAACLAVSTSASRLLSQNFETGAWNIDGRTRVQDHTLPDSSTNKILRATYTPSSKGSERVNQNFDLSSATKSATMSYDLKFSPAFQFVKSGKLHGVGGGTTTTGCGDPDPKGWSVRLTWGRGHAPYGPTSPVGAPKLYVYHQDRPGRCGDSFYVDNFEFKRGIWYRIDVQVQMNSAPQSRDGLARLYVDGNLLLEVPELRFTGHASVNIDNFIFSTFHGGSDPTYSPTKTTYSYFDNFAVHDSLVVTGQQAKDCEFYGHGVYNPTTKVCSIAPATRRRRRRRSPNKGKLVEVSLLGDGAWTELELP